jgi:hypothetical protein
MTLVEIALKHLREKKHLSLIELKLLDRLEKPYIIEEEKQSKIDIERYS